MNEWEKKRKWKYLRKWAKEKSEIVMEREKYHKDIKEKAREKKGNCVVRTSGNK